MTQEDIKVAEEVERLSEEQQDAMFAEAFPILKEASREVECV